MNNSMVKVFESEQFGKVRAINIDGESWFVGKDVAEALGYNDTDQALRRHVDKEDKLTRNFNGSGQNRKMTTINESGLYSLVLSSKLPTAKAFKRWITSEVIPSIRKTGGYIMGQEEMSDIELLSRAMLVAQNQIAQRDSRIAEMEPVVDFAQRCLLAEGAVTTTSIAKNYGLSATKLNQLLKGLGVQYKVGNQWVLYSQYQDCGYTETRRTPIQKKNGETVLVSETLWTPKGIEFIDRMLQTVNVEKVSV